MADNNYSVTVNISMPMSTTSTGALSLTGHMWIVLSDGATSVSYGFEQNEPHSFLEKFRHAGHIVKTDSGEYTNIADTKTFSLTADQYNAIKGFSEANFLDASIMGNYSALTNDCVTFVQRAMGTIGVSLPRVPSFPSPDASQVVMALPLEMSGVLDEAWANWNNNQAQGKSPISIRSATDAGKSVGMQLAELQLPTILLAGDDADAIASAQQRAVAQTALAAKWDALLGSASGTFTAQQNADGSITVAGSNNSTTLNSNGDGVVITSEGDGSIIMTQPGGQSFQLALGSGDDGATQWTITELDPSDPSQRLLSDEQSYAGDALSEEVRTQYESDRPVQEQTYDGNETLREDKTFTYDADGALTETDDNFYREDGTLRENRVERTDGTWEETDYELDGTVVKTGHIALDQGGSQSNGSYGGDYGGSYGGDYGGSYGGDYGGSYGGDYGGSYGGDYGGSYGGDYGGSYGGDYGGSYGGDYGGSYGGDYGGPVYRDYTEVDAADGSSVYTYQDSDGESGKETDDGQGNTTYEREMADGSKDSGWEHSDGSKYDDQTDSAGNFESKLVNADGSEEDTYRYSYGAHGFTRIDAEGNTEYGDWYSGGATEAGWTKVDGSDFDMYNDGHGNVSSEGHEANGDEHDSYTHADSSHGLHYDTSERTGFEDHYADGASYQLGWNNKKDSASYRESLDAAGNYEARTVAADGAIDDERRNADGSHSLATYRPGQYERYDMTSSAGFHDVKTQYVDGGVDERWEDTKGDYSYTWTKADGSTHSERSYQSGETWSNLSYLESTKMADGSSYYLEKNYGGALMERIVNADHSGSYHRILDNYEDVSTWRADGSGEDDIVSNSGHFHTSTFANGGIHTAWDLADGRHEEEWKNNPDGYYKHSYSNPNGDSGYSETYADGRGDSYDAHADGSYTSVDYDSSMHKAHSVNATTDYTDIEYSDGKRTTDYVYTNGGYEHDIWTQSSYESHGYTPPSGDQDGVQWDSVVVNGETIVNDRIVIHAGGGS